MPSNEIAATILESLATYGLQILAAIAIALIGWLLASWVSRSVRSVSERSARVDATLVPVIAQLTRMSILLITLVAVLDKFGINTTSLLAFVGAAGLAIGLALKDTVSDVASGIVLLILRPFNVGHAVDIDGVGGVVDEIGIFQTQLTNFDGVPVILPNSRVRAARIQNFSAAVRRRIEVTVGISYDDDVNVAIAAIRDVVAAEPRLL